MEFNIKNYTSNSAGCMEKYVNVFQNTNTCYQTDKSKENNCNNDVFKILNGTKGG